MTGVTAFNINDVPDHFGRVNTWTMAPFEGDCVFTGRGVLILYAASNQTDMDVMVKLSLLTEAPHCLRVTSGRQIVLTSSDSARKSVFAPLKKDQMVL